MSYPAIADHGLIGDLQTAALVATDGTVDWFCCPRFDSPSIFASILDDQRGGRFALAPVGPPDTREADVPPRTPPSSSPGICPRPASPKSSTSCRSTSRRRLSERRRLVRGVRGIRGEVEFEALIEPRFDYGRRSHEVHVDGPVAMFESASDRARSSELSPLERHGNDVRSRLHGPRR